MNIKTFINEEQPQLQAAATCFTPYNRNKNKGDNNLNQKSQKRAAILAILGIQEKKTLEKAASRLCILAILDLILQRASLDQEEHHEKSWNQSQYKWP